MSFRSHKSQILLSRATCYVQLFFSENPLILEKMKAHSSSTANPTVSIEYVEDLDERIKVTKNLRLRNAFEDYLSARSEVIEAKNMIDPKLQELRDICNYFIRFGDIS